MENKDLSVFSNYMATISEVTLAGHVLNNPDGYVARTLSSDFQPTPFVLRPLELNPPKPQRRVKYVNGTPYFVYYMDGSMKTTHTASHYYNKLTEALDTYFSELLGDNFDLLPSETAVWFDGEEEALPGTHLGDLQAKVLSARGPAKGYRHLHMFKSVTKDGVRHDRLAMMPIVETLCYKR